MEEKNEKVDVVQKKSRDYSIDLIRIVACAIVIATHLTLTTYNIYEVQVDWSRLFTKCFLADGVGIFFLITGFFIANGRSYKETLKGTLKKVVVPFLFFLIFGTIFSKFLINQASLLECIKSINFDTFKLMFNAVLYNNIKSAIPVVAHLWYVVDYMQIIILAPFFYALCRNDNKNVTLARRILIALELLNLLVLDIQKMFPDVVSGAIPTIRVFGLVDPKFMLVLLGYELYLLKDKVKGNKFFLVGGLVSFVFVNILRYRLEMAYMIQHFIVKEEAFMGWDTIFGIISAVSLFLAIYAFNIKSDKLKKVISFLAPYTFGIYLVHFLIIVKVDLFKFEKISTVKFEMLYMFLGTLIVFGVSLGLVVLGDTLKKQLDKHLCKKGHFKKA